MKGKIIQVMGPRVDVEFDGYVKEVDEDREYYKEDYSNMKSPRIFKDQVQNRKPINNPIQGRRY